jgi:hypothetical protein
MATIQNARAFGMAVRVVTTLSIVCAAASLASNPCPDEVNTALNAADLVLSAGQATRTFGQLSKFGTAFTRRVGGLTILREAGSAPRAILEEAAQDAHYLDNVERVDLNLGPVDDQGQAVRKVTDQGVTAETASLSATRKAEDVLASKSAENVTDITATEAKTRLLPCAASFPVAVRVLLADGTYRPIGDTAVGDRVQTRDPFGNLATGTVRTQRVMPAHDRVDVVVRTSDGTTGMVQTTANHWFATAHGWATAGSLAPGDELVTPGSIRATVQSVTSMPNVGDVVDLSVGPDQNYFVRAGNIAVWVHNASCPIARTREAQAWRAIKNNTNRIKGNSITNIFHRRGAIVEEIMDRVYTAVTTANLGSTARPSVGRGLRKIQGPGLINAGGPDGIYFDAF